MIAAATVWAASFPLGLLVCSSTEARVLLAVQGVICVIAICWGSRAPLLPQQLVLFLLGAAVICLLDNGVLHWAAATSAAVRTARPIACASYANPFFLASAGFDPTTETGSYNENLALIWALYRRSTEMNLAVEHLTSSLIKPGLIKIKEDNVSVECTAPLRSFIRTLVRNLMVWSTPIQHAHPPPLTPTTQVSGYAAYKSEAIDETGLPLFQSADGETTTIEFDWDRRTWIAKNVRNRNPNENELEEFDVIVLCEPKPKNPDSFAWMAASDALRLENLHQNFLSRDCANSRHSVPSRKNAPKPEFVR